MFKDWDEIVANCIQNEDVATLECIPALFTNVIGALFMFLGTLTLVMLIITGYRFMNSAGDAKKLEGARNTLINTLLGILLVVLSYFIINIISTVTGVECIRTFGFGCNP